MTADLNATTGFKESFANDFQDSLAGARVAREPFPHLFAPGALSDSTVTMLRESLPRHLYEADLDDYVNVDSGVLRRKEFWLTERNLDRLPEASRALWQRFVSVFQSTLGLSLLAGFDGRPDKGERAMKLVPDIRLVSETCPCVLRPHLDRPEKLLSIIIYLAPDARRPSLGTTLYQKMGETLVPAMVTEFLPGAALVVPRTAQSWHGGRWDAEEGFVRDTAQIFFSA